MMQNLTLSITQLNNYIKNIFDNEEMLIGISVYGEVTNFKISGGIAYFDIKEEGAQLSCVKFSTTVPFAKNGDKVLVTGRLNYHVRLGKLSFVASKVEPYGMGELYKKYLELKARLEDEGLFDTSKKKPLPKYANKIGIVTSETGAVLRDIFNVTRNKNPFTDLLIYPVRVQGLGAEQEIAKGIDFFNKFGEVDLIIVARGGGSFEDLAPFNTEVVARSAYASKLPIISAIGHETDFSILDFVADLRAPTPSVAAEIATFNFFEEIEYLNNIKTNLMSCASRLLDKNIEKVKTINVSIVKTIERQLEISKSQVVNVAQRLGSLVDAKLVDQRHRLENVVARLEKSNPLAILKNGYAKVMKDGKGVNIKHIKKGDEVETFISGGSFVSCVKEVKEDKK